MPRRKARFIQGESYHIFGRGNNSRKIFLVDENYLFFLKRIAECLPSSSVFIHALCLLPNHYHLSIKLLESFDLSAAMKKLLLSYAHAYNKRYNKRGHVFESRFKALMVESGEYLDYLSRYIHRNPVEAKLVDRAEEWDFSSLRCYLDGNESLDWLRSKEYLPRKAALWDFPRIHPEETIRRFSSRTMYNDFVSCDWERDPWRLENGLWKPL